MPDLKLQVGSLLNWKPNEEYDLITCVHGLHYVGDKLAVIAKSLKTLKPDGVFIANLDIDNIKDADGNSLKSYLKKAFVASTITYDSRKKIISCSGRRDLGFNLEYLGANDQIGKNYTGQEVVDSHYRFLSAR